MARGRQSGYKHSEETKEKIRLARLGKEHAPITREKISNTLKGKCKTASHRDSLSSSLLNTEKKCLLRFMELRAEYPEHEKFFDQNQKKFLLAMRTVKSESELQFIRKYIESERLEDAWFSNLSYNYESSSYHAQEDATIALLDALFLLEKSLTAEDKSNLTP